MKKRHAKLIYRSIDKVLAKEDFGIHFFRFHLNRRKYMIRNLESAYLKKCCWYWIIFICLLFIWSFQWGVHWYFKKTSCWKVALYAWRYRNDLSKIKVNKYDRGLYTTSQTQFEYLDYDEAYALAVKCIWVLGDINTFESKEKLKLLSDFENPIIKENTIYQLNYERL